MELLNLHTRCGVYPILIHFDRTSMQVRITHQMPDGTSRELGTQSLSHMPPIGEPFSPDHKTYYTTRAYFGPDDSGQYLLVLEGEPLPERA
jgi:hypothetical protein